MPCGASGKRRQAMKTAMNASRNISTPPMTGNTRGISGTIFSTASASVAAAEVACDDMVGFQVVGREDDGSLPAGDKSCWLAALAQLDQLCVEPYRAQLGEYIGHMGVTAGLNYHLHLHVLGRQRGEGALMVNFIDVGARLRDSGRDSGQ